MTTVFCFTDLTGGWLKVEERGELTQRSYLFQYLDKAYRICDALRTCYINNHLKIVILII